MKLSAYKLSDTAQSGCLLDILFQFWTPYFICHLHVKVLCNSVSEQFGHPVLKFPANLDTLFLNTG